MCVLFVMLAEIVKLRRQASCSESLCFSSFLFSHKNFPISGPSEETEVRTWEGPTGKHHCWYGRNNHDFHVFGLFIWFSPSIA